jgi:two-component system KDP operon response regulator KdpE
MRLRVLVVEGADSIRGMIEALVTARGFEVRSAATGARALEEAHVWSADVVLVDAALAGSPSGFEVCAKLAERELPVVVIGSADDEDKRRALEAGAMAVYDRPFSPTALLKEIEAVARR